MSSTDDPETGDTLPDDFAHLRLRRDGPVLICLVHGREDATVDETTVDELDRVIAILEQDDGIRVGVFAGTRPGYFIRHYSLEQLAERSAGMRARGMSFDPARPVPERGFPALLKRLEEMRKPMVAAITGTAMGGGFELTLACDIRIAQRGPFSIGLPEVNVGLLPGAGGTQRLARLIGPAAAMGLVLTGRTVDPDEALRFGMVHEVVDRPLPRALEIAHALAAKSERAVGHIKQLIRGSLDWSLEDGLARERTLFADLMVGEDAQHLMGEANGGLRDIRDP